MIRMEIALFLVMGMVAFIYFSSEKKITKLHRTFSVLLVTVLVYLAFDGITVYTVNHLDTVPSLLNNLAHRVFMGSMALVIFLFYRYIAILVEEETGKPRKMDKAAWVILVLSELGEWLLPIYYTQTKWGNESDGVYTYVCYASVGFYLFLCSGMLFGNWKKINAKKKFAIGAALIVELMVCVLQGLHHTWLISGMGITLMTLTFYLTLENPDIIRAELTEQKMSMLYLKSQVNPHFLYNTLDDELDLLDAYMELMCYRYPSLHCEYNIDPDLGGVQVPNFILQPLVENSLLHGLKNKGYKGAVVISAQKSGEDMLVTIMDTGSGFAEGKKEQVNSLLTNYAKQAAKLEGNSIGILNVQKRIKLLCGQKYGLWYAENEKGGVTAHLLLPCKEAGK